MGMLDFVRQSNCVYIIMIILMIMKIIIILFGNQKIE